MIFKNFKLKRIPTSKTNLISDVLIQVSWVKDNLEGDFHAGSDRPFHWVDREVRSKLLYIPPEPKTETNNP